MNYHVYFRRPDDCIVYAPLTAPREVSLVHRGKNGRWHCPLCDATDCRHTRAAEGAAGEAANHPAGAGPLGRVITVELEEG